MDLRRYLFENRMTISGFCRKIGYSRCYLSNVMSNRVPASQRVKFLVEVATNGAVGPNDWESEKKPKEEECQ